MSEKILSSKPKNVVKLAEVHLLKELPKTIESCLDNDDLYSELKYVFGLAGQIKPNEIDKRLSESDKSKTSKKRVLNAAQTLKTQLLSNPSQADEMQSKITHEVQQLFALIKDLDNYPDSFNTEQKLFKIIQERYGIKNLANADIGHVLLLFVVFGFERIAIDGCEKFWKLTEGEYDLSRFATIVKICNEILDANPDAIEFSTLVDQAYKLNGRKPINDDLLRFLMSINNRVQRLDNDTFQIHFHELKPDQMAYRVLSESGQHPPTMDVKTIDAEIRRRFKTLGLNAPKTPVKNHLSARNDLYTTVPGGWGLTKWGITRRDPSAILLDWFRDTEKPATRDEMIAHVLTERTDLTPTTVYNWIGTHVKFIQVQMAGQEKAKTDFLFYYELLPLPKNFEKVRKQARKSSTVKTQRGSKKLPVVFISYSHSDEKWREAFRRHLNNYDNQYIEIWDDTALEPGKSWEQGIKDALASAQAALFLVTADFLGSDYIKSKELPLLLEKAKKNETIIYWVLVEDCDFQVSPLAQLQSAFPTKRDLWSLEDHEINTAIKEICMKIKADVTGSA